MFSLATTFHPLRALTLCKQCILAALVLLALSVSHPVKAATTSLGDQPSGTMANIPANVLFTPSVEFPTAISVAHLGAYTKTKTYVGYFDPYKCYDYDGTVTSPWGGNNYFTPFGYTIGVTASSKTASGSDHECSGHWSGNFLNWATMQTIDPFRMAMTGGDRLIDSPTLTVLQKAVASAQGSTSNFPDLWISSATVPTVTPYTSAAYGSGFFMHVWGRGREMSFGNSSGNANLAANNALATHVRVAVRVCDTSTFTVTGGTRNKREDNCVAYGSNFKPEGLIQANYLKMRFGVVSYLNEANVLRDGGVLRARMKDVGPTKTVPGSIPVSNVLSGSNRLSQEWSSVDGTFFTNPDPDDASATGVSNSGVINYINKFGSNNGSYMTYDNVSELYYAGLRYFRNKGNVPEWTNGATAAAKDGFPVLTSWNDPIQYSCQQNFIIGIGDVNTHRDKNVPGATRTSNEPTKPAAVVADTGFDAAAWTNLISSWENTHYTVASGGDGTTIPSPLANANPGATDAAYYIAGMAFWAHTQDIRSAPTDFVGKQTVSTYWIDVLEYQSYHPKNQYWLAAKYGGFFDNNKDGNPNNAVPATCCAPAVATEWRTTGNTFTTGGTTYQLPDNYFVASEPDKLVSGLTAAFSSILAVTGSAAGVGVSASNLQAGSNGSMVFSVFYDSGDWSGNVKANEISSINLATGGVTFNLDWDAQIKLDALVAGSGWQSGNARKVVFGKWVSTTFSAAPFITGNLTAGQTTSLTATGQPIADIVNYLRGDKSKEVTAGTLRKRNHILGDVVSAEAVYVGVPQFLYGDSYNPGYSAFKTSVNSRTPMVYIGANDGMLHAFEGSDSPVTGGVEKWAYIPSFVIDGPNGTPATDGLVALTNPSFSHHYYVNATPETGDVYFSGAGSWRTILVGGLGKGGKGYYAIDVTNPTAMNSETAVAGKVLWEFKDADMGYSFGKPLIVKTKKWGWVVLLTSGYNNTTGTNPGIGFLYVVKAETGALLQKISTGVGSAVTPSGLVHIAGMFPNLLDGNVSEVYGADLLGNLWRFDFTSASASVPTPKNIFTAMVAGVPQAITSPPVVAIDPTTLARYVAFGTGRFLNGSDTFLNQQQTMYVVRDGSLYAPYATPPNALTFPTGRSNMSAVTNLTSGFSFNTSLPMGWYYDLTDVAGTSPNISTERIIIEPAYFEGRLAWASVTPADDICSPNGTSRLYEVNIVNGQTTLLDTSGNKIQFASYMQQINQVKYFNAGGRRVIGTSDSSGTFDIGNTLPALMTPTIFNWREIVPTQ